MLLRDNFECNILACFEKICDEYHVCAFLKYLGIMCMVFSFRSGNPCYSHSGRGFAPLVVNG